MPPMPSMQQPKYTLKDLREVKCSCGSVFFDTTYMMRVASKIMTGEDSDAVVRVPIAVCRKCGKVAEDVTPEEIKSLISV